MEAEMKAKIRYWIEHFDKETGYKHEQIVEDVWEAAKRIFDCGYNIMFYKHPDGNTLLFVDNHRGFRHR